MRGYTGEMEYSVWNDMMSRISQFQKLAESLGCKDAMNKIVTEVVVPTGKKNKLLFSNSRVDYSQTLVTLKLQAKSETL